MYSSRKDLLPALHGKYDVDVDLRIGVCHPQKMSLLAELGNLFSPMYYKYAAPGGAGKPTSSV
jgi:hypothetical protein